MKDAGSHHVDSTLRFGWGRPVCLFPTVMEATPPDPVAATVEAGEVLESPCESPPVGDDGDDKGTPVGDAGRASPARKLKGARGPRKRRPRKKSYAMDGTVDGTPADFGTPSRPWKAHDRVAASCLYEMLVPHCRKGGVRCRHGRGNAGSCLRV